MSDKIIKDLRKWSDDKLVQWMMDSRSRFEIAGFSEQESYAFVMTILMSRLVGDLAKNSTYTPKDFARRMEDCLEFARSCLGKKRKSK